MSAGRSPTASARARVRVFVAAHLALVLALYALAVVAGGGLMPPPFPPELHLVRVARSAPQPPAVHDAPLWVAPAAAPDSALPQRIDPSPPWQVDAKGRVHWRAD